MPAGLHTNPAFRLAADLLRRLGFRFAAHGGRVANTYRATPRVTTDYDFMVDDGDLAQLRDALSADGFSITNYHRPGHDVIGQVRAKRADLAYDFNLISVDYERAAISRAESNNGILAIEDLLIQKLFAWRARDRDDVRSILATKPALDLSIFEEWVDYFEIRDRLVRELKLAGMN